MIMWDEPFDQTGFPAIYAKTIIHKYEGIGSLFLHSLLQLLFFLSHDNLKKDGVIFRVDVSEIMIEISLCPKQSGLHPFIFCEF